MVYYVIGVKLTKKQGTDLIYAFQNMQSVSITFRSNQFSMKEDKMLVTKTQMNKIETSILTGKPVTIQFSKAQLKAMYAQLGNGIFDSIGNLFNKATSGVKNFFTSPKKPVNIEMKNMASLKPKTVPIYKPKPNDYSNDYRPPNYVPPKKSTFDFVADKVVGFDKFINNIFSY